MFPLKDDIPTDRTPWLTIALIVANVVVFALTLGGADALFVGPSSATVFDYGTIPYELTNPGESCELVGEERIVCDAEPDGGPPAWLAVLTSMFLHGGLLHLAGNMLFLWIFGNNIEDSMGRLRFIVFYLAGGVAAALLQTAVDPDSMIPAIGASGAVAGVLGGYLVVYPRARVLTLVFLLVFFAFLRIPALLFLLVWFGQQVLFGLADYATPTGEQGGVAYFAHIGGFVFGAVAVRLFATRIKRDYRRPRPAV